MKNDQMIFGIRPVLEAIEAGKEIDKILLQKGLRGELFHEFWVLSGKWTFRYRWFPSTV